MYKTLLSKEIYSSEFLKEDTNFKSNHTSDVISDFLNLKEDKLFSSERLASTINEYYSLETLRERIIELHKLNLLSNTVNYNSQISKLIEDYEKQINLILNDIHIEIEFNKEKNQTFINKLEEELIVKEILLLIIFVVSLIIVLFVSDSYKEFSNSKEKEVSILDSDMQRIITHIKNEVSKGNFPTIKELRFYLKISHPTLLLKLNQLERDNIISIKKKGRNKHLFLK